MIPMRWFVSYEPVFLNTLTNRLELKPITCYYYFLTKLKTMNNCFSISAKTKRFFVVLFCVACGYISAVPAYGQKVRMTKEEKKAMMRDTLDGKFDFSRFLIDAKGFIPVPLIITEPALGGFGGLLAAMFLTPKKNSTGKGYIPPDITVGAAMYTANGSWLVGGGRIGSIPKAGLKYRAFMGYCNINLNFYRELVNLGEKELKLEFGLDALPVLLSLSKKIGGTELYLGLQYSYANIKAKPKFDTSLYSYFKPEEYDNNIGSLGVFIDWDKRNNIFTADKGTRVNVLYSVDDNWTGSSFEFQKLNGFVNWFLPLKQNWISGLRAEVQHVFDSPPFYAYPYI